MTKQWDALCDVCGQPAAFVARPGGVTSFGQSVTAPSIYGCKDHDLKTERKLQAVHDMIGQIKQLEEAAYKLTLDPALVDRESYFSIWACNQCSAPTFQQPCPFCNFWAVAWSIREEDKIYAVAAEEKEKNRLPFERFESTINWAGGNYAALRLHGWRQTVAYMNNPHYAAAADWALGEAIAMDCPSPRTIWAAMAEHGNIHT